MNTESILTIIFFILLGIGFIAAYLEHGKNYYLADAVCLSMEKEHSGALNSMPTYVARFNYSGQEGQPLEGECRFIMKPRGKAVGHVYVHRTDPAKVRTYYYPSTMLVLGIISLVGALGPLI